ncbi:MAG: hypothetical protein WBB01_01390 [Phormidesmis sp.]
MLNKSIYRMVAGAFTFCLVHSVSTRVCAQEAAAQTETLPELSVEFLLPLEARTVEIESRIDSLEAIAHTINTDFAIAQSPTEPAGLALDSLPIIGELIDAEGNFDWGIDLPIAFNVGSVMGDAGLILSADFAID